MNKNKFIEKSQKIYGLKYSYDKVPDEFNYFSDKICIICPEHGEFWITAKTFCQHSSCPKCDLIKPKGRKKIGLFNFLKKCKMIHGEKYDYSKVEYINGTKKVCIICPEHGEFWQTPNQHYLCGCAKCLSDEKVKNKGIFFIEKSKEIHCNKYDYSKVNYTGMYDKVCIICPEHGEFWQLPVNHMHGKQGCPKCAHSVSNEKDFIEKSNEIHCNKYDYSKVIYSGTHTKVCITCPEHGEFWQTPHHHLKGCGCPSCKESKLEKLIEKELNNKNIFFIKQYKNKWLGKQSLDFYLPDYNIAIECQGEQHFKPIEHFGGVERFVETLFRDKTKQEKCKNQNIKLIYIFEKIFRKNIIKNKILNELYSPYEKYIVNNNKIAIEINKN